MTIYELDDILREAKEFKKSGLNHTAILPTGNFELYDYEAGILKVSITESFITKSYSSNGGVSISTVDDGVWQAESNMPIDEEKALQIIGVFKRFRSLPTEKELNEALIPLGLYGTFTG